MIDRRHALYLFASPLLARAAFATQEWAPSKAVSMVVPFAAAGPADGVARALADALRVPLGQPVIIDNRPGAGGAVAANFVARAAPDGHTLLLAGSSMVTAAAVSRVAYDPVNSFTPIVPVLALEMLLVVRSDLPVRTLQDLVKYAKANPGKLSYGSTGNGSVTHLQMELLKSMTGIDIVHVPYRGSSPALQDLLGGNIQVLFDSLITSGPYLQNGQLRALAIAMNERSTVTPDVPTMAEAGVPGYDATAWTGLLGPPRLPKPVVDRIHREVMTALQDEGVQRRIQVIGGRITGGSTDAYAKRIASESTRWELLVKERNLKTD